MVSVSGRSRSRLRKRESGGPEEGYEKKRNKKENCIEGWEQKDEAKREKGGEEEKM